MKLTALTCKADRPEAWRLCEKYLARQTRQPDQWLILDQDLPMREKVIAAIEMGAIEGDAVIFYEDDDYAFPGWFEWCEERLAKGYDIVGQGNALYYNVRQRWWSECLNTRHASLCQTAISRDMLEPLLNVAQAYDNQFFDTRLWRLEANRYLHLPEDGERLVIGIKGMPGSAGYSTEHRKAAMHEVNGDRSLLKLWQILGDDAEAYAKFYQR